MTTLGSVQPVNLRDLNAPSLQPKDASESAHSTLR